MSPLLHSSFVRVLQIKKTCPHCEKEQIIKLKDKTTSVAKCKFCGEEIPLKKPQEE